MKKQNNQDSLNQLRSIVLPGDTPQDYQRGIRSLILAAQPLVNKGTIEKIKREVQRALEMPIDGSRATSEALFWARYECWPYIHWHRPDQEIPEDRRLMRELYQQASDLGIHPFDIESESPQSSIDTDGVNDPDTEEEHLKKLKQVKSSSIRTPRA